MKTKPRWMRSVIQASGALRPRLPFDRTSKQLRRGAVAAVRMTAARG